MSIHKEYENFLACGGTLSENAYTLYLQKISAHLGDLISNDPDNKSSNIGKKIFGYLNLSTAVAFARVSKGMHERSQKCFFVFRGKEIVLRFIQQGTGYQDYLKDEGWKELALFGAKIACIALTVVAGVEAQEHYNHIPADAPIKTIHGVDENGMPYERTYIDHPEAFAANRWALLSGTMGLGSAVALFMHGQKVYDAFTLETFFSATEAELLENEIPNKALTLICPKYKSWKMQHMRRRLVANPRNWEKHPELIKMVCPLSNDFMLFPVKDNCKNPHYFDYRSIRAYQLSASTTNPSQCPLNREQTNRGLAFIRFDKVKFDAIQRMIQEHNN